MAKNVTWCLMKSIFHKTNLIKTRYLLSVRNRCNHRAEHPLENTVHNDYGDVRSYKHFLDESKASPSTAISSLMKALNVTKKSATDIVEDWKIFGTLSMSTIMNNDDLLRKAGLKKSTLRANMYALADTSPNLRRKVKAIQFMDIEINNGIALFQLPVMRLDEFAYTTKMDRKYMIDCSNRISYLSNYFNIDIYHICIAVCNSIHIFRTPITRLMETTEYLIGIGMQGEHIIKDLIIYRYNLSTIKTKLENAKRAGLSPLKPWMVRSPEHLIEKMKQVRQQRQNILENGMTRQEYLCRELNCDIELVNALMKRDPSLASTGMERLSTILRTLRNHSYTIEEIYYAPQSLHTKPETFKRRYDNWMQVHGKKPPLFVLVLSDTVFKKQLNRCNAK